jgi:hypothetical protein
LAKKGTLGEVKVRMNIGFADPLASKIIAGADRFERTLNAEVRYRLRVAYGLVIETPVEVAVGVSE